MYSGASELCYYRLDEAGLKKFSILIEFMNSLGQTLSSMGCPASSYTRGIF